MSGAARFILAGGGTGGHLYPGLAVAAALRRLRPELEVCVFGTRRPIDQRVAAAHGCALFPQVVQPMPTTRPWRWPAFALAWRQALTEARREFERNRPIAVLGLGGYAAAPPVVVAARLGIPTALFNPDAEPGRANRRLAAYANDIFVQWPDTADYFGAVRERVRVVGCPVRPDVYEATRAAGVARFELDPRRKTLLVTGASQGARSINEACVALIDLWQSRPDWQIVHLTGEADWAMVRAAYEKAGLAAKALAYSEDLPLALAAADLVLARAGASTLAELTARGVAGVLMPYPYDRLQHQRANAAVLERAGAARVVEDAKAATANAAALRPVLAELLESDARRTALATAAAGLGRRDAAERMAAAILSRARQAA